MARGSGKDRASRGRRRVPVVRWALVFVWVCFIWSRSLFTGPQSSGQSSAVVELVAPLFGAVGVTDVELMTFVIRKLAHFTEYFVFGLLLSATRRQRELPWPQLACGLAVPCADETIQLFVPGRTGQLRDVLIDASGMLCGLAVGTLVRAFWRRCRSKARG